VFRCFDGVVLFVFYTIEAAKNKYTTPSNQLKTNNTTPSKQLKTNNTTPSKQLKTNNTTP
jgi:hypothetical protein